MNQVVTLKEEINLGIFFAAVSTEESAEGDVRVDQKLLCELQRSDPSCKV